MTGRPHAASEPAVQRLGRSPPELAELRAAVWSDLGADDSCAAARPDECAGSAVIGGRGLTGCPRARTL